jgi:Tfp pilus assembly major pilin PilA
MNGKGGVILILIVLGLIAFSFYRGYLVLNRSTQPVTNNTEIKLTVDQQKLKADAEKAKKEVENVTKDIDLKPGS